MLLEAHYYASLSALHCGQTELLTVSLLWASQNSRLQRLQRCKKQFLLFTTVKREHSGHLTEVRLSAESVLLSVCSSHAALSDLISTSSEVFRIV